MIMEWTHCYLGQRRVKGNGVAAGEAVKERDEEQLRVTRLNERDRVEVDRETRDSP